jgi:N-acetylmuramoyl-L-alanine amidase
MRKITIIISAAIVVILAMFLVSCDNNSEQQQTPSASPAASVSRAVPQETPMPAAEETPTIEPTPTPVAELKYGTEHEQVRVLQDRLSVLGYLKIEQTTEYYGDATKRAVMLFQSQNGLAADGIAGEQTLALVYSDDAKECTLPLAGKVIGLDPGHQSKQNSEHEPVAPGSGETKPKVSSGTAGRSSGVDEYVVNLQVALKLRELLEEQGATVVMTRETNDVNISNSERALMMNDAGADLVLRLHCNGIDDSSVRGAFILVPSGSHTEGIQEQSAQAAEYILETFVQTTGANNLGISKRSDQTGFNWSTVPVCNIEMGHMSNSEEDELLTSDDYQNKCAQGLCNGIATYFQNR